MSILDVDRIVVGVTAAALRPAGYERRSAGTKKLLLSEPLSETTGYWQFPSSVSSKPPRWILHFALQPDGTFLVDLARGKHGELLPGAATPGYINNGQGMCAVAAFRIVGALQIGPTRFVFPPEWEWLVQFVFPQSLPPGTSGDALTEFSVNSSTIEYKGRGSSRKTYSFALLCLFTAITHPADVHIDNSGHGSYSAASRSLLSWLRSGPAIANSYDVLSDGELGRLSDDLTEVFTGRALPKESMRRDVGNDVYTSLFRRIADGERGFLSENPDGTYLVAPPFATRGTTDSSTHTDPGDGIE